MICALLGASDNIKYLNTKHVVFVTTLFVMHVTPTGAKPMDCNKKKNSTISSWIKSNMAAGSHFEKLQMVIYQQRVILSTSCMYVHYTLLLNAIYHCWQSDWRLETNKVW